MHRVGLRGVQGGGYDIMEIAPTWPRQDTLVFNNNNKRTMSSCFASIATISWDISGPYDMVTQTSRIHQDIGRS
jgi:hypothetical protein